jgi:hypothetical protein
MTATASVAAVLAPPVLVARQPVGPFPSRASATAVASEALYLASQSRRKLYIYDYSGMLQI